MGALFQVLAVFAVIAFARTVFSERSRDPRALGLAAVGIIVTTIFTGWPVHAAAGMLIALLFSRAFSSGRSPWPMLWALSCAVIFAISGASWVFVPTAVAAGLWLFLGNGLAMLSALVGYGSHAQPVPLPEQAGGLPISEPVSPLDAVPEQRPGPVRPEPRQAAAAHPVPDTLTTLLTLPRLPAQAHAQLAELDRVTAEALAARERQGERSGAALYELRALRQEYAPQVVQAYLNLPPTLADTAVLEDGKTGRDLLTEQLDLLLGAAHEQLRHSAQAGSQELRTNGRFLREKFGRQTKDLEV